MMKEIVVYRRQYLPLSETFIYEQIVHLKKYRVHVLSKRSLMNLHVFPHPDVHKISSRRAILAFIKKRNISLIHARFGTGGVDMLPVKIKSKRPLLTSFHGSDLSKEWNVNIHYRRALKKLFRRGEHFTVVSYYMKKKLIQRGCPRAKISVIKSGINLSLFAYQPILPPAPTAYRLLTVGRLVEKKGTRYLIQAFARVLKHYPHSRLVIVGDGPERENLKELAGKLGIAHSISWKGALTHQEVRKEMERCHIFSLPSVTGRDGNQEGIPNVLIEAMALGRPVVTTTHAGIPELVIEGETGLLVPERNEKALTEKILWLMKHPEKWRSLQNQARKRVEKEHDIRKQIKKLEAIYGRLSRRRRSRRW